MTINQLIGIIDLPSKHIQKTSTKKAFYRDEVVSGSLGKGCLHINFGRSLRLVNFQDLIRLIESCSLHNIAIEGFGESKIFDLLVNSIDISRDGGNHVSNGKNLFGKPYSSTVYSLSKVFDNDDTKSNPQNKHEKQIQSAMLEAMIFKDFDMNNVDNRNGETIIFDLIRNNDVLNFHLILQKYVKDKKQKLMLNYHNNRGMSPLYVAIRQFIKLQQNKSNLMVNDEEKQMNNNNGNENENIYRALITNDIENADVNFPAFNRSGVARSILGYVLLRKQWQLAQELINKGAILNSNEMSILVELYCNVAYSGANDVSEAFNTLQKCVSKSGINLTHLCDSDGNNPIHRVFGKIENETNGHGGALNRLINVCPEWILMANKHKKLPVEYGFRLVYLKREATAGSAIDFKMVEILDDMMVHLATKSSDLYTNLVEYRLNEYKRCIFHLRMICLLEATTKNGVGEPTRLIKLLQIFKQAIGNVSIGWEGVFWRMRNSQVKIDSKMVNTFMKHHFGYDLKIEPNTNQNTNQFAGNFTKVTVNEIDVSQTVEYESKYDNVDDDAYDDDSADLMDDVDNEHEDNLDIKESKDRDENDIGDTAQKSSDAVVDLDLTELEEYDEQKEKEKQPLTWIEWIYIFSVESLSCADIITDMFILSQLLVKHLWWSIFSIIFIIAPYLVSYTAMGTILQKKSSVMAVIAMTPLCILYFLVLDIVFMIYAIISSLIFLLTLSKVNIGDWMEIQFFRKWLGISRMELVGYRRLRTLAQLLFETFPSIFLQIRMLHVLNAENDSASDGNVDISYQSLYFSLLFATLHIVMEGGILYLDSKACLLDMVEYAIVCLNARQSWIPFANILEMGGYSRNFNNSNKSIINPNKTSKLNKYRVLDFEKITSNLCCVKYKLDFEFSKSSWQILIKYINNIKSFSPNIVAINSSWNSHSNIINGKHGINTGDLSVDNLLAPLLSVCINTENGMWNKIADTLSSYNKELNIVPHVMQLKFGRQCCKNIDLFDLYLLFQVASNKVLIDCGDIDWVRCIKLTRIQYRDHQLHDILNRIVVYLIKIGGFSSIEHFMNALVLVFPTVDSVNKDQKTIELFHMHGRNVFDVFNSLKNDLLLNSKYNLYPLQQCYKQGIKFGMNCTESNILYFIVYQLIKHQLQFESQLDNNINYSCISGQYIYTAMLLLWYTQGTITNHNCYECNRGWINHLIQFELDHRSRLAEFDQQHGINIDVNHNENNIEKNSRLRSKLTDRINRLVEKYLPKTINVILEPSISETKLAYIPIETACTSITEKMNHLVAEYLYSKAYACTFIAVARESGIFSERLCKELKEKIGNNSCMVKCNSANDIDRIVQMGQIMENGILQQFAPNLIEYHYKVQKHQTVLKPKSTIQNATSFELRFEDFIQVC